MAQHRYEKCSATHVTHVWDEHHCHWCGLDEDADRHVATTLIEHDLYPVPIRHVFALCDVPPIGHGATLDYTAVERVHCVCGWTEDTACHVVGVPKPDSLFAQLLAKSVKELAESD